jgi:hypothetical protein
VYRPLDEIVPTEGFPLGVPLTLQVTAVFDEPVTVAVNCCVFPSITFALVGETERATVGGGGGDDGVEELPPQLASASTATNSPMCMKSLSTVLDERTSCVGCSSDRLAEQVET